MFRVLVPNLASLLSSAFLTATVVLGEFTMAALLVKRDAADLHPAARPEPRAAGRLGPRPAVLLVATTAAAGPVPFLTRRRAQAAQRHVPASERTERRGIDARPSKRSARRSADRSRSSRSTWRWSRASWSACSARPGAARRRRCASPPGSKPDSGAVLVGGRNVVGTPPHRRNMGMVFQSYSLFPNLDVSANVAFGLRVRRVSKAEQQRRVGEALERVHLSHMANRYPHQLSGGQQQRVALARPSWSSRPCCSSTSRCRRSTPRCASTSARRSAASSCSSA